MVGGKVVVEVKVVTLGVCKQASKRARDRLLAVRDHMRPHAIAQ